MKKMVLLASIIVTFFSACSKDPVVEQIPDAKASFSRSFFFPRTSTTENAVSNQTSAVVVKSLYDNSGALVIGIDVALPSGTEQVSLIVKKEKIKAGLAGNYIISPFLTAGKPEGDVNVTYGFSKTSPQTFFILPGAATGELNITSYDATSKLIKGNVVFRINSDKDPRVANTTVWENTQIDVTASFENLQIK